MGKRQEAAAETKRKLLAAGEKLIAEKGFECVSVEDITNACGFGKGTFYTYFRRKEDIIQELNWQSFDGIVQQARLIARESIMDGLKYYFKHFMEPVEGPGIQVCRQWIRNVIDPSSPASKCGLNKWQYDTDMLRDLLTDLTDEGLLISSTPVEILTNILISTLYGMMTCWCMSDALFEPLQQVDSFCDVQLTAIITPYISGTKNNLGGKYENQKTGKP